MCYNTMHFVKNSSLEKQKKNVKNEKGEKWFESQLTRNSVCVYSVTVHNLGYKHFCQMQKKKKIHSAFGVNGCIKEQASPKNIPPDIFHSVKHPRPKVKWK